MKTTDRDNNISARMWREFIEDNLSLLLVYFYSQAIYIIWNQWTENVSS